MSYRNLAVVRDLYILPDMVINERIIKMKKNIVVIVLAVLVLALMMPFFVLDANAIGTNCAHQWLYLGEGKAFVFKDITEHNVYKTDEYKCVKCGAKKSYLHNNDYTSEKHTFTYIDLGHINPYSHEYDHACKCSY